VENFKLLRGTPLPSLQIPPRFDPTSIIEPMRQDSFIVTFPEHFNIPSHLITTVNMPTLSFNHNMSQWGDFEFSLLDVVGHSPLQSLLELANSPHQIVVKVGFLTPTSTIQSEWVISGTISSVNFGSLCYSSDNLIETKIKMSVSNVFINF
jgi:hypothetical protein